MTFFSLVKKKGKLNTILMFFLKSTLMSTVKLSDISTVLKTKLHGLFSTCYSAALERYLQLVDTHTHKLRFTPTRVCKSHRWVCRDRGNLTGRL